MAGIAEPVASNRARLGDRGGVGGAQLASLALGWGNQNWDGERFDGERYGERFDGERYGGRFDGERFGGERYGGRWEGERFGGERSKMAIAAGKAIASAPRAIGGR